MKRKLEFKARIELAFMNNVSKPTCRANLCAIINEKNEEIFSYDLNIYRGISPVDVAYNVFSVFLDSKGFLKLPEPLKSKLSEHYLQKLRDPKKATEKEIITQGRDSLDGEILEYFVTIYKIA